MSIKEHPPQEPLHIPVLLESVVTLLQLKVGETYLDLTAGYGGHASRILGITGNYAGSVLVDRDAAAIKQLQPLSDKGAQLVRSDFFTASQQLVEQGRTFDMILVDLGVSSPQLDQGARGFSFTNNGPLDMRMDQAQVISAETLVNQAPAEELVRIITEYGEEPIGRARNIARAIVASRPLYETKDLADLIAKNYRGKWQKIHPATRTFQALRIAVNDELQQIENLLPLLPKLLASGGRVAIISFHSLEDRLVKRYFQEQFDSGYEAELLPLAKKPILGSINDVHNPRARSSKLRAAVKK
jgi:16S rRNA (cytosine1402-N4)-methyltransferase